MANKTISGALLNVQNHREIAKIGMGATLASVCLTALFMKNKSVRKLHIASGWAFVGFSLYHAGLYDGGVIKNFINKQAAKSRDKKADPQISQTKDVGEAKAKRRARKAKA